MTSPTRASDSTTPAVEGARPKKRRRTPKTDVYEMRGGEPDLAVVRCPDDDVDTFWSAALAVIDEQGQLAECWPAMFELDENGHALGIPDDDAHAICRRIVKPPEWKWYRFNPASALDREDWGWTWLLGQPRGAGPGNWRGALVTLDMDAYRVAVSEAEAALDGVRARDGVG